MRHQEYDAIMLDHYETNEFDYWADTVVERGLTALEKQGIEKYMPDKSRPMLEMGCGGGRVTGSLIDKGYTTIIAADFSALYCRQHKKRFSLNHQTKQTQCNMRWLPFKRHSFEYLLYTANVLSFLPNLVSINNAVQEAARVLKPGGVFMFTALNFWGRPINIPLYIATFVSRFSHGAVIGGRSLPWLKKQHKINWSFLKKDQPQAYWFTGNELRRLCETNGFSCIECSAKRDIINTETLFGVFLKVPS